MPPALTDGDGEGATDGEPDNDSDASVVNCGEAEPPGEGEIEMVESWVTVWLFSEELDEVIEAVADDMRDREDLAVAEPPRFVSEDVTETVAELLLDGDADCVLKTVVVIELVMKDEGEPVSEIDVAIVTVAELITDTVTVTVVEPITDDDSVAEPVTDAETTPVPLTVADTVLETTEYVGELDPAEPED